jgi:hypothetical protein
VNEFNENAEEDETADDANDDIDDVRGWMIVGEDVVRNADHQRKRDEQLDQGSPKHCPEINEKDFENMTKRMETSANQHVGVRIQPKLWNRLSRPVERYRPYLFE